jgi:hypothetical protein
VTGNGKEPSNEAEPDNGQTAFERFESLTKRLVRVPKVELDAARKKSEAKRRRAAKQP